MGENKGQLLNLLIFLIGCLVLSNHFPEIHFTLVGSLMKFFISDPQKEYFFGFWNVAWCQIYMNKLIGRNRGFNNQIIVGNRLKIE